MATDTLITIPIAVAPNAALIESLQAGDGVWHKDKKVHPSWSAQFDDIICKLITLFFSTAVNVGQDKLITTFKDFRRCAHGYIIKLCEALVYVV